MWQVRRRLTRPEQRRSPRAEPARNVRAGSANRLSLQRYGLGKALMTLDERSSLVLAFTRVLFINGQATDQTVDAAERLGRALGLRAKLMPRWGELQLLSDDED